ncbi:MAG TPA: hypothetical protein VMY41_20180, partial [Thermohalobaculum sp.]|nr:hypothetical protein [Thermohalobaculum sp.]
DFHPCASDPKAPRSGLLKIQLDDTSSSWQSLHILSKRYVLRRSVEPTSAQRTFHVPDDAFAKFISPDPRERHAVTESPMQ